MAWQEVNTQEHLVILNSIHKPPAKPVRIEKVLPIPREHDSLVQS